MDTMALHRLKLELHKLNVQRWFKLPRIQQIFRTMNFPDPKIAGKVNTGTEEVNVQAAEHKGEEILHQLHQQPMMGNMQIPKNIQSMVNGYLARFKSTSQLLSETLKAIHPGMVGREKGAKKGRQNTLPDVVFLSNARGIISRNLSTLKNPSCMHRWLLFRIRCVAQQFQSLSANF